MDAWNFLKFYTLIYLKTRHLYTHPSPSVDVHPEYSYGLDNFSLFYRLFSVFWTHFLKQEILSLKLKKNFDLNGKLILN